MSSILEKERKQGQKGSIFQSDTEEEETVLIGSARKRSMLPKGNSTLKEHISEYVWAQKIVFVLEFDEDDDDEDDYDDRWSHKTTKR